HAGALYASGRGLLKKSLVGAVDAFRIACDHGHPRACTRLGRIDRDEDAFANKQYEVGPLLLRGCKLGDGEGCRDASRRLEERNPPYRDEVTMVILDQQGCAAGLKESCAFVER